MTEAQTLNVIARLRAAHANLPPLTPAQVAEHASWNKDAGCYCDDQDDEEGSEDE